MQVISSGTAERVAIGRSLSRLLANTLALRAKTRRFGRDVSGIDSIVLRPLLAQQCHELDLATDRIAQRMRALGMAAPRPHLRPPIPPAHQTWTAEEMIGCLVERHETVARRIRSVLRLAENAADFATCDLLRQRIDAHERATWVLARIGMVELICGLVAPRATRRQREGKVTSMARTLVVYYSRSGTTRKAAAAIAQALGADVEELADLRSRTGFVGYVRSVVDAVTGRLTALERPLHRPEDYDLVVFGSPVWAASLSTPVRTYLLRNYDDLEEVAFFCTCKSRGGERVLRQMADLCRTEPVASLVLRETEVLRGSFRRKGDRFASELLKALEETGRPPVEAGDERTDCTCESGEPPPRS